VSRVAQHTGHGQVFDDEPVGGFDQRVGDLMQEVAANRGDPVVPARAVASVRPSRRSK
jgi:hypothetical protein